MKTILLFLFFLFPAIVRGAEPVLVIPVSGAISPATSDFISSGLTKAENEGFQLAVIELDTPGGLDSSMRSIIRKILASPVPVAVYVMPSGARAASAGTYILYAAHIAAMAPGTNLGAASPVEIGGKPGNTMMHKVTNDAAAYIRSLAELRGRNADWGELAVRNAESIPANKALQLHVIDYVAPSLSKLLDALDGKTIETASGNRILSTRNARIVTLSPGWKIRLLSIITDPNIAYALMVIGIYGIGFELANPGFGLPGVTGSICLILAMFAFQFLPVNYAGLALIVLALILFAAEAFFPSYGSLGFGGVISFILGSIFLMNENGGVRIAWQLILTASLFSGFLIFGIARMALKTRKKLIVTGSEAIEGSMALSVEDFQSSGHVRMNGEIWNAKSLHPVKKGEKLKVTGREGLTVIVERE
ncbi:MAG: nodulation protein NfeD [Burkholderiales bacterium]|nr:nodulation protein NfeD [Burkholderiales bacterium]